MIYDNILQTIGNTPIVCLNRMGPDHVVLYGKVESFNPMASVKDRLAFAIINDAEQKGTLQPGQTVIEATSGNTGIALAMVCAAKGYPFVATMADSFSIERRKIMRGLGAKVILTPAAERGTGMVKKAEELAVRHGWFLASQFENPANPEYHANTTAPEILRDFAGKRLDYWVTGYGTGGTMSGAGRILKAARPELTVVATEPEGATLLAGNDWAPHKIQGWTYLRVFRQGRRWPPLWRSPRVPLRDLSSSRCCRTQVSVTCRHRFSRVSTKNLTTTGWIRFNDLHR